MVANEWTEWKQKKEKEKKVADWISRFREAKNRHEWGKVYESYLKSDIWVEIRAQAINRASGKCENCGLKYGSLHVHHKSYKHIGGNELPEELKALCYPCHLIADRKREILVDERRKKGRYQARLDGFASRKYGDDWEFDHDEDEIEVEFIAFLYKRYCEENDFAYDPDLDPDTDVDLLEFWNSVLNGNQ